MPIHYDNIKGLGYIVMNYNGDNHVRRYREYKDKQGREIKLYELNHSFIEILDILDRGICPFPLPEYEFMIKCRPNSNYNEKNFTFKIIKSNFPKKDIKKSKGQVQNIKAFRQHFEKELNKIPNPGSIAFPNLSGNIQLVIPMLEPSRNGKFKDFSTIYAFNKNASEERKKAFWKKVGEMALNELFKKGSSKQITLSTDGHGVSYLHFRIGDYAIKKDYGYTGNLDNDFPLTNNDNVTYN